MDRHRIIRSSTVRSRDGAVGYLRTQQQASGLLERQPHKLRPLRSLRHSMVATQNGLDRLDRRTGTFTAFTQRDGLPGNAVGCVLEDNSGNLWMSTNNGVARFNSERKTFSNFSVADGLPGPNLTGWSACFQSPSGEMFFGGFNGGASFFPDKVVDSSDAPPIVLTDFCLSGNPVAIGGNSPLRRSISYTRDLVLPNQENVFSITFAALHYSSPAATRYRYRLENLERIWNE